MAQDLYVAFALGRIFGGKVRREDGKLFLDNGVEFMVGMGNRMEVTVIAVVAGDFEIPEGLVLMKADSKSPYFESYYKAQSGLHLGSH